MNKQKNPCQRITSFPSVISQNVPLHDKNWFCTGGAARFFCAPTTDYEFQQALMWGNEQQCPTHILGQGANTLISDDGFDGLIIRPMLNDIDSAETGADHCHVTAGAGVSIHDLILSNLEHNIIG